jgi:glycosyltransferase involved in cell wall biosynthesis
MSTAFTIAIPTHDRRELVTLAVRSALAQTRPPLEVLVLADGCTDGTAEALSALGDARVRAIELPKGTGYGYEHRNVALREARGDVVAWLGDDDLLFPDHLATIGTAWDAGDVELVQASAVLVDEAGAFTAMCSDWSVERFRAEALRGHNRTPMAAVSHLPGPALAARGWKDSLERGGDIDLWRRMLEAGTRTRMCATPTVLHPRGSWREQTPEERLAQNAALAATLSDPVRAARLRADAVRAAQRELAAREAELDTARGQLADERAHFEDERRRLAVELDAVYTETARQHELLAAIYAGGWWRLRDRLLALPAAPRLARAARRLSRRAG